MFKNLKIGVRLGLGFGTVLLLMVIIIGIGVSRLGLVDEITEKIVTKDWVKASHAVEVRSVANDNAKANMELFLTSDKQAVAKILDRIENNKKKITDRLEQLESLLYLPEG